MGVWMYVRGCLALDESWGHSKEGKNHGKASNDSEGGLKVFYRNPYRNFHFFS